MRAKETVLFAGGGPSVALARSGDRYQHEVSAAAGDNKHALLRSLEGADQEVWPSSPPFQELHIERPREGIEVALVVGRAGRSHWSAAIEADRGQETITFDVACRSSGQIDWLGSRYRCLVDIGRLADSDRTLVLASGDELQVLEGDLRIIGTGPMPVVAVVPRFSASPAAQTVRWKYRIARRLR